MIPDFKIRVNPSQSEEIQRLVFQLGGTWSNGYKNILRIPHNNFFLFLETSSYSNNSKLSWDLNENTFIHRDLPEYTFDELKNVFLSLLSGNSGENIILPQQQNTPTAPSEAQREANIPYFKVRVTPQQNEAIQRLVMALGGKWINDSTEIEPHHYDEPFLFYDYNGFSYASNENWFLDQNIPEYTFDELNSKLSRLLSYQPNPLSPQRNTGFEKLVVRKESSKELADVDNIINEFKRLMGYRYDS